MGIQSHVRKVQAVLEDPSGAAELPGVGSAADVLRRPLDFFVDAGQHGPVCRFDAFGTPIYVVSPSAAKPLLSVGAGCPITRKGLFTTFSSEVGVDAFGSEGQAHRNAKRLIRLEYSRRITAPFVPAMIDHTQRTARMWRVGDSVPMLETAGRIAATHVMQALTPVDLSDEMQRVVRFSNRVMYVTTGVLPAVTLRAPRYQEDKRHLTAACRRAVDAHRRGDFDGEKRIWMMDAFMASRTPSGEAMSDDALCGAAMYAVCGAYIYLSRACAFTLHHLLHDPPRLRQALDEIDTAFATSEVGAEMCMRLTTLRAVWHEVMRMYPLVSGLPFMARSDVEVAGCRIPKGGLVLVSSIANHDNAADFHHPLEFDPDRWTNRSHSRRRGSLGPFGLGSRTSEAVGMSELAALSTIATILHTVRLVLPHASYRPRLALNPLLGAADGLPARVAALRTDDDRRIRPEVLRPTYLAPVLRSPSSPCEIRLKEPDHTRQRIALSAVLLASTAAFTVGARAGAEKSRFMDRVVEQVRGFFGGAEVAAPAGRKQTAAPATPITLSVVRPLLEEPISVSGAHGGNGAPLEGYTYRYGVLIDNDIPLMRLPKDSTKALAALRRGVGLVKETTWSHTQVAVLIQEVGDLCRLGFTTDPFFAVPLPGEKWFSKTWRNGRLHAHQRGPFYIVHADRHPGFPKTLSDLKHIIEDVAPALLKRLCGVAKHPVIFQDGWKR